MENNKKIVVFIAGLILAGSFVAVFFPKEGRRNQDAVIRIGAGDDVSGILMEETVGELSERYAVSEGYESSCFQDC